MNKINVLLCLLLNTTAACTATCHVYALPPFLSQIRDESGLGNIAEIDIRARANLFNPEFDANGDLVDGIDYSVPFLEDEDQSVQIVSSRALFGDDDFDPEIVTVTVTLLNPALEPADEFLSLEQDSAIHPGLDIRGNGTTTIVIETTDTSLTVPVDFISVLLFVRYTNLAPEPIGIARVIRFTVNDGLRENDPKSFTIVFIQTNNDIPVIDLDVSPEEFNGFYQYSEASPAIFIAQDLVISDPDNSRIAQAFISFDTVYDVGNETIAIDEGLLSDTGVSCMSSCNGTSIVLNGAAFQSVYQTILRSLSYINLQQPQDLPNLRDRVIYIYVSDGQLLSDETRQILVDFIPLDPRVIIQLDVPNQNYSTQFIEGQLNDIAVTGLVRIVDTSLETLESVVVSIRDNLPGRVREDGEFIFLSDLEGLGDISIEINTVLKRITFSQEAPIDDYVTAINRIRYTNQEEEPLAVTRFVDFLVIPGGGAPNDTAHARIFFVHINDNDPICMPETRTFSISESTEPIATDITEPLVATDADEGVGGNLSYVLIAGDTSLFLVTTEGGVDLVGYLDFEATPLHEIRVQASDDGNPSRTCNFTVEIQVTDANDNPPVFQPNFTETSIVENIPESGSPSIIVVSFNITDEDSGSIGEISTLTITSFSPVLGCMGLFTVSLNPPSLSLASPGLDYETVIDNNHSCVLTIVAGDGQPERRNGTAIVRVSIVNEDDFPPEFDRVIFEFSIEEDNDIGDVVDPAPGRVTANDRDSPSFTFSSSSPDFLVNSLSGEVRVNFRTNYDINTDHRFTVFATDPAGNSNSTEVIVYVIPINNDPPVLDLNVTDTTTNNAATPVVFQEESGIPVTIPTIPGISDLDPVDVPLEIVLVLVDVVNSPNRGSEWLTIPPLNASEYFIPESGSGGVLRIMPLNGAITDIGGILEILQTIQYENREDEFSPCTDSILYPCSFGNNSRTVRFLISDGIFTSEAAAFVRLEPRNDPPELDLDTFTTGFNFTVQFTEGGDPVPIAMAAGVSITDADDNRFTELTCTLTNPLDGADESLILLGQASTLTSSIAPDGHSISVTGSGTAGEYSFTLGEMRYNSATQNPTTDVRSVECYISDGESVSNIAVAMIFYEAVNQPPELDLDSTSTSLNFFTTFVEEDGPVLLTNGPRILDIDNVNLQSVVAILEGAFGPEEVLSLDQSLLTASLSYRYEFPTLVVEGIENVEIYRNIIASVTYDNTAPEIDNATDRAVSFTITDESRNQSFPVITTVQIQIVDDNPPVFFPTAIYNFTVAENTPSGMLIENGTIEVTDADRPQLSDIPIFRIASSNPSYGTSDFVIQNNPDNPLQGQILVFGDIDYDFKTQTYDLEVIAESGPYAVTALVHIDVENLRDLPPVFVSFPNFFMVAEGSEVNTSLLPDQDVPVLAVDQDFLEDIVYSVTGNVINGVELVRIDPATGQLFVQNDIDRELPLRMFQVNITASDSNGNVSAGISVEVVGINEHDPVFDEPSYQASITENDVPSPFPLLSVTTTDQDEFPDQADPGFISSINYTILPGSGSEHFYINPSNGSIYQLDPLDFEVYSSISLVVEANDDDYSPAPRTAAVIVTINVVNINDERCQISVSPFITVSELRQIGYGFGMVVVEDSDPDSDVQITFAASPPPVFSLNSTTGELSVSSTLDADSGLKVYDVTIIATDLNTDSRYLDRASCVANTTLAIEDQNDNAPSFVNALFEGYIVENDPAGSTVQGLSISATDNDCGVTPLGMPNGNNELRYFLGDDVPTVTNETGSTIDLFVIDESTGVLTKQVVIDREVASDYQFTVIVMDTPIFDTENTDTAQVRVVVRDVNEFAPFADPDVYYSFIPESTTVDSQLPTLASIRWSTDREFPRVPCASVQTMLVAINPLPTIGNSLKKQESMYKVLTPSIKPPYKFLWLMGAHDAYMHHWLVKG